LIPTFAATAWYHGRLWPEAKIEEVVDFARRFAYEDYTPFMLQPNRASPHEQNLFYSKLSQLIGLKEETVRRYCGRFDELLYTTEFMAPERKVIGGLDSRYVGDLSGIQRLPFEDPSYRDMQGISCAFRAYLQKELNTHRPLAPPYASYSSHLYWNFATYDSFLLPDVLQRLRRTLIRNPQMKVFSGSGYYDCRTPFAATEFCFDHMELPPSYRKNLQFEYYEGGHGFVFDLNCLKKLQKDLIQFYER
jgi:carboxypeptidase C (cathepsin A)